MPDPQDPAQTPAQNEPVAPASDPAATPSAQPQDPAVPANEPAPAPADPAATPAPDGTQTPAPAEPAPAAPPQSRAERRIKQLNDKVREAHQPNQPIAGQPQSPQFPNYQDGQVVSPEQLERDVVQTADAIATIRVNQQLAQHDAKNNFDRDRETVPAKYAELTPDTPGYVPELDEAIAQEFQERAFTQVGVDAQGKPIMQLNPSVRLSDIAERHVRGARAAAAKASAATNTAVDAVADSMAPRPTGERPADTPFENLTIEQMRAKIGYHKV